MDNNREGKYPFHVLITFVMLWWFCMLFIDYSLSSKSLLITQYDKEYRVYVCVYIIPSMRLYVY